MFPEGDDLPLFSGTPQTVIDQPFVPEDHSWKQVMLPGMPGIDYDAVRAKDLALHHRRKGQKHEQSGDLFSALPATDNPESAAAPTLAPASEHDRSPARKGERRPQRKKAAVPVAAAEHQLREALSPYLNTRELRRLVAIGSANLYEALTSGDPPKEVLTLLDVLATLLRPPEREQITGPADIAALLMVEMGHLQQEQLRVVCLNTKNYIQEIHTVYQGSLNSSLVRIAEVFRKPLRLNSASIIVAHNHPSHDPTPSPEDVAVTRQIIEAGRLLDIEVLDHLVIGQGKWISLRERRLGFSTLVRTKIYSNIVWGTQDICASSFVYSIKIKRTRLSSCRSSAALSQFSSCFKSDTAAGF